ncbi:MAG: hypothetical protein HY360_10270 [Verrucomicrobia bacterium]|nr:hypothetical protein [Verrucomicrobiota bacterium]
MLPSGGHGREAINTFGMMINYYRATWDPQGLLFLRQMAEGALEKPLAEGLQGGFPIWYKTWAERYYELTRDNRAVERIKEYIATGVVRHSALGAFAYRATRDPRYLDGPIPQVQRDTRLVYRNPEDPLNGFGHWNAARGEEALMQLPTFLHAADLAGRQTRGLVQNGSQKPRPARRQGRGCDDPQGWRDGGLCHSNAGHVLPRL